MAQPHPKLDQLRALGQRKLKERAGRDVPSASAREIAASAMADALVRSTKSAERATEKRAARRARR